MSGGSYVAAAHALTAAQLAASSDASVPPLVDGSPEASHIANRGRYLVEDGICVTAVRFFIPALLNILALFFLFVWLGFMLADLDWLIGRAAVRWDANFLLPPMSIWAQWVLAAVALFGGAITLRGLAKDGGVKRYGVPLLGLCLLFLTGSSLVARMRETPALSDPNWWRDVRFWGVWLVVAIGLLVVSTYWTFAPPRTFASRLASRAVSLVAVSIPRAIGVVLLSVSTVKLAATLGPGVEDGASSTAQADAGIVIVVSLLGGFLASAIPNRVSLNRLYRRLLSRCFAVVRSWGVAGETTLVSGATLAGVAPPSHAGDTSFPGLLVCATANVRWRDPQGTRRSFAPFILSHDYCGVPGVDYAYFATSKLELGRVPSIRPWRKEPQLSLMSAVTMAGAALSPSMGRMTLPALRPFLAAINLRTGAWMPNPFSDRVRTRVALLHNPRPIFRDKGLGGGYDQLLSELFGMQAADGRQVYVTDGGHYDNLGLTTLLRAGCAEIWCVDAEPDKRGKARQLRQVLDLATSELGVEIQIDLSRFHVAEGCVAAAHAQGVIRYPGGSGGRLVVIKLGVTRAAPQEFREYRTRDRKFPYHPTILQWYSSARVDAYRKLGRLNARAALEAEQLRS